MRDATDEQRSRRPIFIATLWAGASWLFFLRRGGSTRMTQIWALRSRLEKSAAAEPPAKYLVFRGQDTSACRAIRHEEAPTLVDLVIHLEESLLELLNQ